MVSLSTAQLENQALRTLAAGGRIANLLSPSGATRSTVSQILAAAGDIINIVDTSSALLADFNSLTGDPISTSFSRGQPYAGTFITSPTVTLVPINTLNNNLNSSTLAIAALTFAQIAALSGRTGIDIKSDTDLAAALAILFAEASTNSRTGFSVTLTDDSTITPVVIPTQPVATYALPLITPNPTSALLDFVASISGSFPDTPGIEGVAASVWVDGLGVSVNADGSTIGGVPQGIDPGVYGDITGAANNISPSAPVTLVDYSYQQNQYNTVLALTIDNGLIGTFQSILSNPLATSVSSQVMRNRLGSVAARGDTAMLLALVQALGVSNVPNAENLLTLLLQSLGLNPTLTAGGISLTTNTNQRTTAEQISDIQALLSLLGITIQQLMSQNTCNSVFCSQNLLNVPLIKACNKDVIEALLGIDLVHMAYMF